MTRLILTAWLVLASAGTALAQSYDYRVLATSKTSTMEKEMNESAEAGYSFHAVMGGETMGGNEVVVVMAKTAGAESANRKTYKLLATRKTSTMEKELGELGEEGFEYRGQTVFDSAFGGREVSVILERDGATQARRFAYRVQATSKTSTMQKELQQVGRDGYKLMGMTVAKTSFGGNELVCILSKEVD
ncbi:MAG: hypothetical protein GC160_01520 [Acidobacteria bacterium]|nr:hypothetical protein [Acidobacteriota bacterium]